MAKKSIQNLIDTEIYGDILLHGAKFLEDDNAITVDYLRSKFVEYTNDLDEQILRIIRDNSIIKSYFVECMLDAITSNTDIRTAHKNFIKSLLTTNEDILSVLKYSHIHLIDSDEDVQQSIKSFLLDMLQTDSQIQDAIRALQS